ncbi:hypothetical protein H5P28_13670 [Ruficoccus amylovorans]|uniref:Uncharacterized protein n=1 Tax=Ruficoccus amylovorans TaxID=1804625 RepID=A0A842HFX6_9BACT|nr:hypothetical protein [Ruficoccus amylovorans]MBC2595312.1 hypothetical protein [Ruficoccus amylovorans]
MRHCLPPQAGINGRSRGFALIVAISLMSFIFLLLITLSQLTQIETKVGSTQNNLNLARQNAILGLKNAIGQLQLVAGPDQRVSATAGILDSTPADADTITGVAEPYWTGIWNSSYPAGTSVHSSGALANYRNTADRRNETGNTFQSWLVSDSDNVSALDFDRTSDEAVLLLGEGSVSDEDTEGVYAPKVTVRNDSTPTGHYAYWVGDEGVKARFDAIDPHADGSVNSPVDPSIPQGKLSLMLAQRLGVENALDLDLQANKDADNFSKAASQKQLELLAYNGGGSDYAKTQTREAFHDVSFYSAGVLSNVRDGGLKKDLTAFFEQGVGSALPTTMPAFDRTGVTEYTQYGANLVNDNKGIADFPAPANEFSPGSPSWDQLRAFAQLKDRANTSVTPTIRTAGLSEDYPVGPVLVRAQLDFMPEFTPTATSTDTAPEYDLKVHVAIRAQLWNPYNVALSAHNYEVEFMLKDAAAKLFPVLAKNGVGVDGSGQLNGPFQVIGSGTTSDKGIDSSIDGVFQHANVTSYTVPDASASSGYSTVAGFVFKIDDVSLPAGSVKIYSLPNGTSATYDGENELDQGDFSGTVTLDFGTVTVDPSVMDIDPTTGSATVQPKFVWRNWNDLSESTQGSIGSMAVLEPVDVDGGQSRDLFDTASDSPVGLDRYFSRLSGRPLSRIGMTGTSGDSIDAINNPLFAPVFKVSAFLYPINDYPANFSSGEEPIMLTHSNALARQAAPSGLNLDATNATQAPYIVPGWGAELGYDTSLTSWSSADRFGTSFGLSGVTSAVIAELPPQDVPILSLGWLQHARLLDNNMGPTFLIGNSMPNVFIDDLTELERDSGTGYATTDGEPAAIDAAYLLNDALWDPFFLSTVETPADLNDDDYVAANSRLKRIHYSETDIPAAQLNDFFDFAAANLMLEGAFNINSTSVDAWKAFLGSLGDLELDPETGATAGGSTLERLYTHLASPSQGDDVDNTLTDVWNGYRTLSDEQLDTLARAMVEQVKQRGPFFSLSEFINRRLSNDAYGQRGALQAAINASGINDPVLDNAGIGAGRLTDGLPSPFLEVGSQGYHYDATTGWITQGDIVQALGPFMSARSDTFIIRAYGDAVDPITAAVQGQAWCEAIVQRMPTPVNPASTSTNDPDYFEPSDPDSLGRQFKVIAFRWLSEDEV